MQQKECNSLFMFGTVWIGFQYLLLWDAGVDGEDWV